MRVWPTVGDCSQQTLFPLSRLALSATKTSTACWPLSPGCSQRGRGSHLCVVGAPFSDTEKKLIVELDLASAIEHYEQVSDAHLAKLYYHSVAFVYPSLYEGFGIPPLEAMASRHTRCGFESFQHSRSCW